MEKTIPIGAATRSLSKLLEEVKRGHSFVITSRGRPVATIGPVAGPSRVEAAAREILFKRLREQPVVDKVRWTRDELYRRWE